MKDFNVGDLVACAGANRATHSELVLVPENLVVAIPKGCSLKDASSVAVGSIAMHGLGLEIWAGRLPRHDLAVLIEEVVAPVLDFRVEVVGGLQPVLVVADEEECESAIAMIERDRLDHCAIFKLTNEPHYAENIDHASKHVRKWEEYDVRASMFDYFSTGEYKQTESIVSDYLSGVLELERHRPRVVVDVQ